VGRNTGAVCRICRREARKLFLKGDRCYTPKCGVERRPYPPGQHGQTRRKVTDYAMQLREKQALRHRYGMAEKQLRRYFAMAERGKGVKGEALLQLMERRLDNVVYRLGIASSRVEARQMVVHRHIAVDSRTAGTPSMLLRPGQVVAVRPQRRSLPLFQQAAQRAAARRGVPTWLSFEPEALAGKVLSLPRREEIDTEATEQLVVEFYSR